MKIIQVKPKICCDVMECNMLTCIFYKGNFVMHNHVEGMGSVYDSVIMHDMRVGNGLSLSPINYCHACGKKVEFE